jgi:hypothetical protein
MGKNAEITVIGVGLTAPILRPKLREVVRRSFSMAMAFDRSRLQGAIDAWEHCLRAPSRSASDQNPPQRLAIGPAALTNAASPFEGHVFSPQKSGVYKVLMLNEIEPRH